MVLAAAGTAMVPQSVVAATVSLAHTLVVVGAGITSGAVPASVAELAAGILRDITMRITTKVLATAVLIAGSIGGIGLGFGQSGGSIAATAAPRRRRLRRRSRLPNRKKPSRNRRRLDGPAPRLLELKPDADGKVKVLKIQGTGVFVRGGVAGIQIGGGGGGAGPIQIGGGGGGAGRVPIGGAGGGGAGPVPIGGGRGGGGAFGMQGGFTSELVELGKLKDLTVTTAGGKEVSNEDALKKLAKGGVVVVSTDGKKVSTTYLKLFKDDVLVLHVAGSSASRWNSLWRRSDAGDVS